VSPLLLNSKSITQIVFWSSTWIKLASSQAFPSFSLYITPIFLKGWSCSVFLDKKHPRPPSFSPLMLVKWVHTQLDSQQGFLLFSHKNSTLIWTNVGLFFFLKRTFDLDFDNNFFPLDEGASLNLVLHIFKSFGFLFWHIFKKFKKVQSTLKNQVQFHVHTTHLLRLHIVQVQRYTWS